MYNYVDQYMNARKEEMLEAFRQLDASLPENGDLLFETFGAGSAANTQPYERYHDYELTLILLKQENSNKYELLHKGMPYFFLGWLAFQMRNYEAANFYIVAAIKEDERKSNGLAFDVWINNPAGQFMLLQEANHAASVVTIVMRAFVNDSLIRYAINTSTDLIGLDTFVEKFVRVLLSQGDYSVVTALYGFIMGFEDTYHYLLLTGSNPGSLDPVVLHLFQGGRIFEILAKKYYPTTDKSGPIETLGGLLLNSEFRSDFPFFEKDDFRQKVDSLKDIVYTSTAFDVKTTFENTVKLRNLSGHNMLSIEMSSVSVEDYRKLFEQVITAILLLVTNQW